MSIVQVNMLIDAINEGMRIDLNGKGIKVGAINPGMVATEFSEVRFKRRCPKGF